MNRFYKFAMRVMRLLMPLWYKIETEGMENVPHESGYLYISNHRSNADPILIGIQNKETQFCFLAKQELFSDGLVGWLLRKLGGVAIDRGAGDVTALEEIAYRLQNGENALVFPEGTRSKDGTLGHFKTGAALLAAQTGVPVVPVAIVFDGKLHFRSKILVRYGAPFDVPETDAGDPSPAVLKQIRREMTDRVSGLLTVKEPEIPARIALPDRQMQQKANSETKQNETIESEATENEMSKQNQRRGQQGNRPDPQKKRNQQADSFDEEVKETEELFSEADSDVNEEDEFDFIFDDFDDDDEDDADADFIPEDEDGTVTEELAEEAAESAADFADGESYDEEPYDGDDSEPEEESYAEEDYDGEDIQEEPAFGDEYEGESYDAEGEEKPSLLFRITNPFRKLIRSLNAEPEYPEDDEEDEEAEDFADDADEAEQPADPFEEDAVQEEDDFFAEDDAPAEEAPAAEEPEQEIAKTKQRKFVWKNTEEEPEEPVFDETDDFADDFGDDNYDQDGYGDYDDAEGYDDGESYDDADDDRAAAGFALRSPFRRKSQRSNEQPDAPDGGDEPPADYDDDELAGEGGFDYGKIALILTFVILGIFAIDFCRRAWDSWHRDKDMLSIQSSDSSEPDSAVDSVPDVAEQTSTTSTQEAAVSTTTSTMISTSPVSDTSDGGGADVETRDTSVLTVNNDELHHGSAVLIDADHQQTFNPSLVTFADVKVDHIRLTSTYLQFDSSMSADLKRWISDFYAATGHGNIMVYCTNQQPTAAVSAAVPYGVQIPERASGLTLDLAILDEAKKTHKPYTPDGDYAWLSDHAAEYGFIVRYPEGKEEQTGLEGKTWHFRYVGIPHAKYMADNDLTLEEYLEKISVHTWEKEHLTATAGGVTYEMYYVPASETAATTDIQYPVGAEPVVSGDNVEGFLVYCVKQ
ncbi:MAG: 1-acylglycerol-3-phosphate O-acyltransferase [Oscillospiraceae bacterium]|nr:1-acylglycerol-3-phosphate O-acyltransferase [Oscillospiraceae bacterium]